jgi:hypothetical protein
MIAVLAEGNDEKHIWGKFACYIAFAALFLLGNYLYRLLL